jgi:hypothetical protein
MSNEPQDLEDYQISFYEALGTHPNVDSPPSSPSKPPSRRSATDQISFYEEVGSIDTLADSNDFESPFHEEVPPSEGLEEDQVSMLQNDIADSDITSGESPLPIPEEEDYE